MKKKLKQLVSILSAFSLLAASIVTVNMSVLASGFTGSEIQAPAKATLTQVINFDDGLQGFVGGGFQKEGTSGAFSTAVSETSLGYGESGASVKWTYDKTKEYFGSPSLQDGTKEWYSTDGDGFFMWIKSEAVGTVRFQGFLEDYTTVHCDAELEIGENLAFFPYDSFKTADGSAVSAFEILGYGITLYAQTLPDTGTLYVDAFGTYEGDITGFVASEKRVPAIISLNQIKNFDEGLQSFTGGGTQKESTTGTFSNVETYVKLGYGDSGASLKWTYDKTMEADGAPYLYDSSNNWYANGGDGYFLWIKSSAAGAVRLQGLLNDWQTTAYCDAELEIGENLVYFPSDSFKNVANDEKVAFDNFGNGIKLYALTLPESGVLYIDAFGTYVDNTPIPEPDFFTPSTLRLPDGVGLRTYRNFDGGLQRFTGGNAGATGNGSKVVYSSAYGYGESGGSAKWSWNKVAATSNSPAFRDDSEDFYDTIGDGFFMWIKSDSAGTVRLQGLADDWLTSAYCDVEIAEGENLVFFPYTDFKKGEDESAEFKMLGYHLVLYPIGMPNRGSMYIDSFGVYGPGLSELEGGMTVGHTTENHKLIDDFSDYQDDFELISVWTEINSGSNRSGCKMSLDNSGDNSVSGNSLKVEFNSGKADWSSPGAQKRKPDNQDFQGDGFCFWLKTEKEMSMRVAYLTEDCEAVYDIKNIPTGYEGYIHIPYFEMKYYQAGIEVPYEEIGFVPTDFYYFTFYAYGPKQSADYNNVMWIDDMKFFSKAAFENPSSTVTNVVIDGRVESVVEEEFSIFLNNDTFKAMESDTDISAWFNLPKGLKATVKNKIFSGNSSVRVVVSGVVGELANGLLSITIEGKYLASGSNLTVTPNANAKFASPTVEEDNNDLENTETNNTQNNSINTDTSIGNGSNLNNNSNNTGNSAEAKKNVYARISSFTVEGRVGSVFKEKRLRISISGDTLKAIKAGTDVTAWFNLPKGLSAKVSEDVEEGDYRVIVAVSGTVKEECEGVLKAVIGGEYLSSGEALKVDDNEKSVITIKPKAGKADTKTENTGIPVATVIIIIIAAIVILLGAAAAIIIIKRKKS